MQATVAIQFKHTVLSFLGESNNLNPETFIQYGKPGTH